MKVTRVLALCLIVVMLTACMEPAQPVATLGTAEGTESTQSFPTEALPPETEASQPETEPTLAETEPSVPETEPTQPLQPLSERKDSELVKIADYLPGIAQELAYATENNFTGKVVYAFTDAYLRAGTLKKLEKAREILLSQGYDLKIWDGFRPVYAQAKLYEAWPDPNYVSHPVTGYRAHCRGNAVDLTLIDLATGQELEMPTGFDDFSAKADRDYSDCTETQRSNAKLLESAMTSAGFTPYQSEWWHYTDPISYLVDEYFDPAVVSLWKANCDEYITLRTEPDSKADSRGIIRKDEVFTLMGWTEAFAYVSFQGKTGFVLSSYICPVEDWGLSIVQPANPYSYEQMLADIETLADTYPDAVTLGSIGKSEAGRDIPVILLGDPEAETHILIQSTVHALEHMCTWLTMSITEYHAARGGIDGVCFHIIPMMNPDGVILAQTGEMTELQKEIYESDKARYYTQDEPEDYAALWKANGLGVDINRNFDAGWQQTSSRPVPSVMLYKGTEPFSSAEAAALRDYTLSREFAVTVSYHAMGCVIYWQYGSKEPVNSLSESLGQAVGTVTGYSLHGSDGLDAAGYKDWSIDALEIPSLTIEIGCGDMPLADREMYAILGRNLEVLPALAKWVRES